MVAYANDLQLKTNPGGPVATSLSALAGESQALLFIPSCTSKLYFCSHEPVSFVGITGVQCRMQGVVSGLVFYWLRPFTSVYFSILVFQGIIFIKRLLQKVIFLTSCLYLTYCVTDVLPELMCLLIRIRFYPYRPANGVHIDGPCIRN